MFFAIFTVSGSNLCARYFTIAMPNGFYNFQIYLHKLRLFVLYTLHIVRFVINGFNFIFLSYLFIKKYYNIYINSWSMCVDFSRKRQNFDQITCLIVRTSDLKTDCFGTVMLRVRVIIVLFRFWIPISISLRRLGTSNMLKMYTSKLYTSSGNFLKLLISEQNSECTQMLRFRIVIIHLFQVAGLLFSHIDTN